MIYIKSIGKMPPLSQLMMKDVLFLWDDCCQEAFEKLKEYLKTPPVLGAPITGRPLILYIAATYCSLGAMLAQINEEGKEQALYYLSRRLMRTEESYSYIEKTCLALVFAVKKL